jgi:hypothetical protein
MHLSKLLAAVLLALSAPAIQTANAPVEPALAERTHVRSSASEPSVERVAAARAGRSAESASRPRPLSAAAAGNAGAIEQDALPNGWLMALVTIALIGYQLRRKHRLLRPQRFT